MPDGHTPVKLYRCPMVAAELLYTRCQCPPVAFFMVKITAACPMVASAKFFTRCQCSPVFARFRLLPCQNQREEDLGRLILFCQFRKTRATSLRYTTGPLRHPSHCVDSAHLLKTCPSNHSNFDYGPLKVYLKFVHSYPHLDYNVPTTGARSRCYRSMLPSLQPRFS